MTNCAIEITSLIGLFEELGVHINLPITMVCDSMETIQIAANSIFHEQTKHIDIDCHFMREKISQGLLKLSSQTQKINSLTYLRKVLVKLNTNYC